MKFADTGHPFYKPLWRRLLIVAAVASWAAYEVLGSREPLWMTISLGMLAYAVWVFILAWPQSDEPQK